ncbi:MAG: hypothetical protein Q8O88_01545 [bacterium]|nr:hypothetical protein [bacterium]
MKLSYVLVGDDDRIIAQSYSRKRILKDALTYERLTKNNAFVFVEVDR